MRRGANREGVNSLVTLDRRAKETVAGGRQASKGVVHCRGPKRRRSQGGSRQGRGVAGKSVKNRPKKGPCRLAGARLWKGVR